MKNNDQRRIFFGISVGDQIKSILPEIKSAVRCKSSLIKWIPFKNIHLTLSFLGNIPNNDIPDFIQSVENNISTSQFHFRISGTGVFPCEQAPKVLWLGIDKGLNELKLLHQQIEISVRKLKVNYENNVFVPHITIAKIKKECRKIDVLPFLNCVYSQIETEVNFISMYQSKLFPEGAEHTVLNTFQLN